MVDDKIVDVEVRYGVVTVTMFVVKPDVTIDEQFIDCDTDDDPIDVGFVDVSLESDDLAEEKLFIELEVVLPLEKQFVDDVQFKVVFPLLG